MLGDLLNVPQRDIYVKSGFDLFEIQKHPWYREAERLDIPVQSVIKSHEMPGSTLIDFDAVYIHLFRDGRDVVVSKWFYDRDFCVKNGIVESFQEEFDDYVVRTAREWSEYVAAWSKLAVVTARYEDFLACPVESLRCVLGEINGAVFSDQELRSTLSKFSRENFSAMLGGVFQHNTFVRKGVAGDWRNHFSKQNVDDFKANAGGALLSLGYELNDDWSV